MGRPIRPGLDGNRGGRTPASLLPFKPRSLTCHDLYGCEGRYSATNKALPRSEARRISFPGWYACLAAEILRLRPQDDMRTNEA
ncbi:MAG TPA: hypothetical protein VH186_00400 [Chloroflexia bacterium]|nr:hypothetical protein [Chloroflexia bacterium]